MPRIRAGLRAALVGRPGLAALVGTRVRPGFLGQDDPPPAITYLVIADAAESDLDGEDGTRVARVQVDCWAETLLAAEAIAAEARAALLASRDAGSLGGVPTRWLAPEGDADAVDHRGDGSDRAYARVRSDFTIRYTGT